MAGHNAAPTGPPGESRPIELREPLWSRDWARASLWALLGGVCGSFVGFLMSSYTCEFPLAQLNCYPYQALKIDLLAAFGVLAGLVAERLRRSMSDRPKAIMTAVTVILLVVLAAACYNRINPWSCNDSNFCQVGDAVAST